MTEPLPPRPEPRRQWSRRLRDRLATLLITAGGLGVVAAVLAIGVFLALEVAPLFLAAEASLGWGELWREYWQPGTLPGETPAYGMLPLAWGTLKAAFWALLFAIPLALGRIFLSLSALKRNSVLKALVVDYCRIAHR